MATLSIKQKQSSSSARKIIISSGSSAAPTLPPDYYDKSIRALKAASEALLHQTKSKMSREALYKLVESLVVHKYTDQLYNKVSELFYGSAFVIWTRRLDTMDDSNNISMLMYEHQLVCTPTETAAVDFINEQLALYDEFSRYRFYMRHLCLPLDRATSRAKLYDVGVAAVQKLYLACDTRQHYQSEDDKGVANHPKYSDQPIKGTNYVQLAANMVKAVNICVVNERSSCCDGEFDVQSSQLQLVKRAVQFMRELGLYLQFEEMFLVMTDSFYEAEAKRILSLQLPEYLSTITSRWDYETHLCDDIIGDARQQVNHILEKHFLLNPLKQLLAPNSLYSLLDSDDNKSQYSLYNYLLRVDKLSDFRAQLVNWGKAAGSKLLDSDDFISSLLNLRSKIGSLVQLFDNHKLFSHLIKEVFEFLLNNYGTKAPISLAKSINGVLKTSKSSAAFGNMPVERQLDNFVVLFNYLLNKDVFREFYKNHFSKRLLSKTYISLDYERYFISKLKTECGAHYTAKLEGMLADMDLSSELANLYSNHRINHMDSTKLPDFEPMTLTQGYWPNDGSQSNDKSTSSSSASPSSNVNLPVAIQSLKNSYEDYYGQKYRGRRLTFCHSLGNITIKATINKKTYTISLNELSAYVLLQFNPDDEGESPTHSVIDLMKKLNLNMEDITAHLLTLSKGKYKLLIHRPDKTKPRPEKKSQLHSTDLFTINPSFSAPTIKIKVPMVSLPDETRAKIAQEEARSMELVQRDRGHAIDASIVRIMKARKTLSHNDLLREITTQLISRFQFSKPDVKKRIESLIEREYIARDENDSSIYNYLA